MNDLSELHGRKGDFASVIFFLFFFCVCVFCRGDGFKEREMFFACLYMQMNIAHNPDSEQRLLPR